MLKNQQQVLRMNFEEDGLGALSGSILGKMERMVEEIEKRCKEMKRLVD